MTVRDYWLLALAILDDPDRARRVLEENEGDVRAAYEWLVADAAAQQDT